MDCLIPKDVTRVSRLIHETGADGANVTVAVLDTGVDPGAPGLQLTTSNKRKIVDIIDCTASGDVNTSTVVTLAEDADTICAPSGRTLRLPSEVRNLNPSRRYHIGVKQGYELFPNALVKRLRKERKIQWGRDMRRALSAVWEKISVLKQTSAVGKNCLTRLKLQDLEARQAVLLGAQKHYRDCGPLYDCIVFHDGENWRAIVDTTERGALAECDVLEDYAINQRFSQFGSGVMMNFGVNIYDNGNVLSIVVDGGSHGTHVAGILAAHFPDDPSRNGLAPGAHIVSLKIGDSRLSSMETHQGLMRAIAYCLNHSVSEGSDADFPLEENVSSERIEIDGQSAELEFVPSGDQDAVQQSSHTIDRAEEGQTPPRPSTPKRIPHRIDVCNLSYGEHSRDVNKGRFVQLLNKLVYEHNVMFLSSAGNEGPGLSSVSAPGGTTAAIMGVGAYVTPRMLTETYSLLNSEFGHSSVSRYPLSITDSPVSDRKSTCPESTEDVISDVGPVPGLPFTWSSRGPVQDGGMGVSICAPGGAIAPVPVWMLRKKMLMNGTSMASPSAAGAVAAILSFLKTRGITYTSALVRRAIENTARPLDPPGLRPRLGEKHRGDSKSEKGTTPGKFDTEYYQDLVFAAGNGSIDAYKACRYLERYECLRAHTGEQVEKASDRKFDAVDSAHKDMNGTLPRESKTRNAEAADVRGSLSFSLEDWRIDTVVEDGSAARRGSSRTGCGALNTTRGIYLRGEAETNAAHRAIVTVTVVGSRPGCERAKRALANMEVKLSVKCEAPWVDVPASVILLGGGRSFHVVVDPVALAAGSAHFAEVVAYVSHRDGSLPLSGPIFRVPVSVHKPEPLVDGLMISPLRDISFVPGSVVRRFYEAPLGSTFALLRITAGTPVTMSEGKSSLQNGRELFDLSHVTSNLPSDDGESTSVSERISNVTLPGSTPLRMHDVDADGETRHERDLKGSGNVSAKRSILNVGAAGSRNYEAHIVRLGPQQHCGELESRHYFALRPGSTKECLVQVSGGLTFELCLAQMWISPGPSFIEKVELMFGGVHPHPTYLYASPGALSFPRVEVGRMLPSASGEKALPLMSNFAPRGSLSHLQRVVAPLKSRITALGSRDFLPETETMFQLQLDYAFEVYDSNSVVKLLFPGLNRAVYEAEFEGGPYVIVHDKQRRFLFASDIYPDEKSLCKGQYCATAYVRYDRAEYLERIQDLGMTVDYKLSSEPSLDAYDSEQGAALRLDSRKLSKETVTLETAEHRAFYFSMPRSVPKWAALGDLLLGSMTVDRIPEVARSSSRRQKWGGSDLPSYKIALGVGPASASSSDKRDALTDTKEDTTSLVKPQSRNLTGPQNANGDEATLNKGGDDKKVEDDPEQWLEGEIRDLKLKRLQSLVSKGDWSSFDSVYGKVHEKYPDDVEILLCKLERLDVESCKAYRRNGATSIYRKAVESLCTTADQVIEKLDAMGIAAHFGMMIDPESTEEATTRKSFERKRAQITESCFRKARGLCHLALTHAKIELSNIVAICGVEVSETDSGESSEAERFKAGDLEALEKSLKDLSRWTGLDGKGSIPSASWTGLSDGSATNEDLTLLCSMREIIRGRYGSAMGVLDNFYGPMASKRLESERVVRFREGLLREIGWDFLASSEGSYCALRFPQHRAPF